MGRPNVGKSALFNRILGKKRAIVDEAEGITRDRLYGDAEVFGRLFEVIDTGGIDSRSKEDYNELIKRQAEIAIEEADTLIMVVDAKIGPTELDHELAAFLQKTQKPLCLAVNKIDSPEKEDLKWAFQCLGIKNLVPVSASQNWHIAELLEEAFSSFPSPELHEPELPGIHVAIIGRPNVGKSSLINYLLDEDRCIVSPLPGTTRDSVDVSVTFNDACFTFIDTAGVRRKHSEHEVVDKFAFIRTERAIERSDICLLMIDAEEGMTTQEKKIANMIEEAGKSCILLLNKWDLVKGFRMEHCFRAIKEEVPFLKHCPKMMISVKTGRNIEKIFDLIQKVHADSEKRITTHQLNNFMERCLQKTPPPMIRGKRLRIYYMTQIAIKPPKFVLFINYPDLMTKTYQRYILNQLRGEYGFTGVPVSLFLRGKKES